MFLQHVQMIGIPLWYLDLWTNVLLSWAFLVTVPTKDFRKQLQLAFSSKEFLHLVTSSKPVTFLLIVEAVFLLSSRDTTCLTKHFQCLDFKLRITAVSVYCSFAVKFLSKNINLTKFRSSFSIKQSKWRSSHFNCLSSCPRKLFIISVVVHEFALTK